MAIKARYHTQPRQSVAQAGPGRSGSAGFQSPATKALLAAPPRLLSAENLHWRAPAKPEGFSSLGPALALPVSPVSPDKLSLADTFHRRPGALPAPVSIRFPHSG